MDPSKLLDLLLEFIGLQGGILPALILKLLKMWLTTTKRAEFATMVATRASAAKQGPGRNPSTN